MKKALALAYGLVAYALFFVAFLYLIGFLSNAFVPISIDVGPEAPAGPALLGNLGLIVLFGLQHSVMARPGFKRAWTKWIPEPIERSTYVLASTVVLVAVLYFWRPLPTVIWDLSGTASGTAVWGVYAFGWLFLLTSTFLINHFDLFGLRQVACFARGREPRDLAFTDRLFYKFVRHPIYLGWTLVFWATPTMTLGHLVFAAGMQLYILAAVPLEERDLITIHGERYRQYRRRVPAVLPRLTPAPREAAPGATS